MRVHFGERILKSGFLRAHCVRAWRDGMAEIGYIMEKVYQIVDDITQIVLSEMSTREKAEFIRDYHGLDGTSIREKMVYGREELILFIRQFMCGNYFKFVEDRIWGYPQCMYEGLMLDIVALSATEDKLYANVWDSRGCRRLECEDLSREELDYLYERMCDQSKNNEK